MWFNLYRIISLTLLIALMMALLIIATKQGMGITTDSIRYLSAAESLANRQGLIELNEDGRLTFMTHYPPLYPLILSLFGDVGNDILNGSRWLNIIIYVLNASVVGIIIFVETKNNIAFAFVGMLLMMASQPILYIHSMVWTEPLFILFTLVGTLGVIESIKRKRIIFLYVAVLSLSLGLLTKYLGLSLIIANTIALLLFHSIPYKKRILHGTLLVSLATFPLLMWEMYKITCKGIPHDRQIYFHPWKTGHLMQALQAFESFFLQNVAVGAISMLVILTVVACLAYVTCKKIQIFKSDEFELRCGLQKVRDMFILPYIFMVTVVMYLIEIGLTICFLDIQTPCDERILSPLFVLSIPTAICVVYMVVERMNKIVKYGILVSLLVIALINSLQTYAWAQNASVQGIAFNSVSWKSSEMIGWLRNIHPAIKVYSNAPDALYLHLHRITPIIPLKFDVNTGKYNEGIKDEIRKMNAEIREGKAIVVYFRNSKTRWYLPKEEEIIEHIKAEKSFETTAECAYGTLRRNIEHNDE